MTSKNNRAPLLCYVKFCTSIQTGVTVQKHSIWAKIGDFLSCVTLKFDRWPWKTIGHLSVLETSSPSVRDRQFLVRTRNFLHISLQINVWISQNSDQDLQLIQLSPEHWHLFYATVKLFTSFHSHQWIKTGVTVQKCAIQVKIIDFCCVWPWNLTDITLKNNKAPVLCYFKLCASFHSHQ